MAIITTAAAILIASALTLAQTVPWNNPGNAQNPNAQQQGGPAGPAPLRDLTGIWDAGGGGISGPGHVASPFTPLGEKMIAAMKPGNGPRAVFVTEINDPLSTLADPAGFPRNVLYELRPVQIVQTPNSVLMLYMFEKRWRKIWTDGRALPTQPDPRWYGYSVGRWADDTTLVVQSVGMDERTWLDNAGNPHSPDMRVEERYHRVNANTIELTVTIDDPAVYTKPWTPRNRLPLRLVPPDTDFMEMINSASESQAMNALYKSQSAGRGANPR
jgi:hypothetical protein